MAKEKVVIKKNLKPNKNITESDKKKLKSKKIKPKVVSIKKIQEIKETEKKKIEEIKVKKDSVISKLKKEIKESEQVLNDEKNVRKIGIIVFLVFCFIVIILSSAFIDYSSASLKNKTPKTAIKIDNDEKQVSVYYGLFYKAYKCYNDDDIIFLTYPTEEPKCTYEIRYDSEGYYTNPYGIKISKEQISVISRYYEDVINSWKTEQELEDAYEISLEFSGLFWIRKNVEINIENGETAAVAIFSKLTDNGWEIQYLDENYQKCVKQTKDGTYLFSEYSNNTCVGEWATIKPSEEFCNLIKTDESFIKNIVTINGLCE